MVYATTLSESQSLMRWWIILGYFCSGIHHIAVVENIVSDALSKLTSTSVDKYGNNEIKAQCHANKLFTIGSVENNEDFFPLNI